MLVVQVPQVQVVEETVEIPQLRPVSHGHCRCHARRYATTAAGWFRRRKTAKVRSCSTS